MPDSYGFLPDLLSGVPFLLINQKKGSIYSSFLFPYLTLLMVSKLLFFVLKNNKFISGRQIILTKASAMDFVGLRLDFQSLSDPENVISIAKMY